MEETSLITNDEYFLDHRTNSGLSSMLIQQSFTHTYMYAQSLTQSSTHAPSFAHSLSFTHSTHSFTPSLTHSLTLSIILLHPSLTHLDLDTLIHSLTQSAPTPSLTFTRIDHILIRPLFGLTWRSHQTCSCVHTRHDPHSFHNTVRQCTVGVNSENTSQT